jgi:hypothetical protein
MVEIVANKGQLKRFGHVKENLVQVRFTSNGF